jgi:hypothetical protein
VVSSYLSSSRVSLLVFTGDKSLTPQGIVPIPPEMTANEMTHEMLRLSIPLVLNFNKRNQPLIHTLPIKVNHSAAVNIRNASISHQCRFNVALLSWQFYIPIITALHPTFWLMHGPLNLTLTLALPIIIVIIT